jgi:hypothetical protein
MRLVRWSPVCPSLVDLRAASELAGVELRDVVAAVVRRDLRATDGHPGRPGVWMVDRAELEEWARRRRQPRLRLVRGGGKLRVAASNRLP